MRKSGKGNDRRHFAGKTGKRQTSKTLLDNVKHGQVYLWKKCLEQQKTEQSGGRSFMVQWLQPTLELLRKNERQDPTKVETVMLWAEQTLKASLHVICSRMLCVAAVSSVSTCLTELM